MIKKLRHSVFSDKNLINACTRETRKILKSINFPPPIYLPWDATLCFFISSDSLILRDSVRFLIRKKKNAKSFALIHTSNILDASTKAMRVDQENLKQKNFVETPCM